MFEYPYGNPWQRDDIEQPWWRYGGEDPEQSFDQFSTLPTTFHLPAVQFGPRSPINVHEPTLGDPEFVEQFFPRVETDPNTGGTNDAPSQEEQEALGSGRFGAFDDFDNLSTGPGSQGRGLSVSPGKAAGTVLGALTGFALGAPAGLGQIGGRVGGFFDNLFGLPEIDVFAAPQFAPTPAEAPPGGGLDNSPEGLGSQYGFDPAEDVSGPAGGPDSGGYGGDASTDNDAWAEGGLVTRDRLKGPNPPGPDDGRGFLDVGEFVLNKDAVRRLGLPFLFDLNKMR